MFRNVQLVRCPNNVNRAGDPAQQMATYSETLRGDAAVHVSCLLLRMHLFNGLERWFPFNRHGDLDSALLRTVCLMGHNLLVRENHFNLTVYTLAASLTRFYFYHVQFFFDSVR